LRRKKVLVGNQWLSAQPNEIDICFGFAECVKSVQNGTKLRGKHKVLPLCVD
jgi:hypothetical protein